METSSTPTLASVSRETAVHILGYLPIEELCRPSHRVVCKSIRAAWSDLLLWRGIAVRVYGRDTVDASLQHYPDVNDAAGGGSRGGYMAMVLDDNRLGAMPAINFTPPRPSEWKRNTPDRHCICVVLGAAFHRPSNTIRVYIDARGEGDWRPPATFAVSRGGGASADDRSDFLASLRYSLFTEELEAESVTGADDAEDASGEEVVADPWGSVRRGEVDVRQLARHDREFVSMMSSVTMGSGGGISQSSEDAREPPIQGGFTSLLLPAGGGTCPRRGRCKGYASFDASRFSSPGEYRFEFAHSDGGSVHEDYPPVPLFEIPEGGDLLSAFVTASTGGAGRVVYAGISSTPFDLDTALRERERFAAHVPEDVLERPTWAI